MIISGSGAKKWLEGLNRTEKLEIPLTFFTKGPQAVSITWTPTFRIRFW